MDPQTILLMACRDWRSSTAWASIRAQYAGDDPAMRNDIQEKSLRDALEKTIKEGQTNFHSYAQK